MAHARLCLELFRALRVGTRINLRPSSSNHNSAMLPAGGGREQAWGGLGRPVMAVPAKPQVETDVEHSVGLQLTLGLGRDLKLVH